MFKDKQDKGSVVEMEMSDTILLSTSTGTTKVIPQLLPSTNTNHDTLSNVSANVDDAATSRQTPIIKIHLMNKEFAEEGQVIYKPTILISITFQGQLLPDRILISKHYFDMKP
ncbi:hypothetical protein PR048_003089 [Dryococelus australis]|uniref:Uncharacterized protein n=1 Tax=Dryococelus australis TaxID=614101 RepID=A0ABQ9IM47_9NEOP|nr:hypothetical protein PR048_003089 [Dryococelus australis]